MPVQFGWDDLWMLYGRAEGEQRAQIEEVATECIKTLIISEQIKALANCPKEFRDRVTQELSPEVRRKFNISTNNINWSEVLKRR